MFDAKTYKKNALVQLKGRWFLPCVVTLFIGVILGFAAFGWGIVFAAVVGILNTGFIFVLMSLHSSDEKPTFDVFFQGIERTWLNAFLAGLWKFLWVFLWSLLFIIPGIVKLYSYSMMFFIIAENPKISAAKAMNISKILTNGHKGDLFLLDLSFIGWAILSSLASGIGYIWLTPYIYSTRTNAYFDLKRMAFQVGMLSPADFEA